jgi:DNA-directed RNA polymerase specialized sigma24 family protein
VIARGQDGSDPTAQIERSEQIQVLLAALDEFHRRLLKLYLEGNSTVEAARILGLDPDFLRVKRSRMFERLRAGGLKIE